MSPAEQELDRLFLEEPETVERLLRSWALLIGDKRLWWQQTVEWEDAPERWASCVRGSIREISVNLGIAPRQLAEWLDICPLPITRATVLRKARLAFHARS